MSATLYGPWRRIEIAEPLTELKRLPGGAGLIGLNLSLFIVNAYGDPVKIDVGSGEPGYEIVLMRHEFMQYDSHHVDIVCVPPCTGPFVYRVERNADRHVTVRHCDARKARTLVRARNRALRRAADQRAAWDAALCWFFRLTQAPSYATEARERWIKEQW